MDAGELALDDLLREIGGADASIVGLRKYSETADVYNLTIADDHTYFVGVDEVLAHNTRCESAALGLLHGIPLKEAKNLVSMWDKATHSTRYDSIRYHAKKHGYGNDIPKYLRKAANFNKKGASKKNLEDGATRWNRTNGEFLIERGGKIVSYGVNQI